MLGNRALENRINKIKALEAQKKDLEAQINMLKDELRADMTERGVEEYSTGNYIIRFKEIVSSTFDSARFKKDQFDMYTAYQKITASTRLTIN